MGNQTTEATEQKIDDYSLRRALIDKPWVDATLEEKIEKMRLCLKDLDTTNQYTSQSILSMQQKIGNLENHEHSSVTGKCTIPLVGNNTHPGAYGVLGSIGGQLKAKSALD